MKILYDSISGEYIYPLSKNDISKIRQVVSDDILRNIRSIRFGCNIRTTQEGRTVQHGGVFDIRINFCLNKFRTLLLSENRSYISLLKNFGGIIDLSSRTVTWKLSDAKRYALFLLLHEIGHIAFAKSSENTLTGRTSVLEEQWCDNYALPRIDKIFKRIGRVERYRTPSEE